MTWVIQNNPSLLLLKGDFFKITFRQLLSFFLAIFKCNFEVTNGFEDAPECLEISKNPVLWAPETSAFSMYLWNLSLTFITREKWAESYVGMR